MPDRASGWVALRIKQMGSPCWPTIPAQTGTELEAFAFNILNYEPFGQGPLLYNLGDDAPDWIRMSYPAVHGTVPDADGDQSYEIPIIVHNDLGSDTVNLIVNVEDTVNVPVWSAIPNQRLTYRESINLGLDSYLTGTTPLTVMASGLPAGMSFDANSRRITGQSTAFGTREVIVRASNRLGSASASFEINVRDIPPQWSTIPDQTLRSNEAIELDLNDYITADVFEVTFQSSSLPPGITINDDGVVTGSSTFVGTSQVSIRAVNTSGSATARFNMTITP